MSETLKDKGKRLQKQRDYHVDVDKYILVHVDGRSFSKNIKNKYKKPFDNEFIGMMNQVAVYLCENVQGAKIAYTQSDEITLLLKKDVPEGDIFFGGRLCKMQSIIASLATAKFNQLALMRDIWKTGDPHVEFLKNDKVFSTENVVNMIENHPLYQFDCKVWDVDTANDALAWFLFRNIDCVRNSKQQFAQTYLPHKILLKHSTDEQVLMAIDEKGMDWRACTNGQKFGRIISKEEYQFTTDDGETYTRTRWVPHDGTDLTIEENRTEFIEKYNFFK